jgi:hypothetical protein
MFGPGVEGEVFAQFKSYSPPQPLREAIADALQIWESLNYRDFITGQSFAMTQDEVARIQKARAELVADLKSLMRFNLGSDEFENAAWPLIFKWARAARLSEMFGRF